METFTQQLLRILQNHGAIVVDNNHTWPYVVNAFMEPICMVEPWAMQNLQRRSFIIQDDCEDVELWIITQEGLDYKC